MPALGPNAKAIVSAVMSILIVLDQVFGISLGIGEEYVTIILAVLSPIFTWLVRNRGS